MRAHQRQAQGQTQGPQHEVTAVVVQAHRVGVQVALLAADRDDVQTGGAGLVGEEGRVVVVAVDHGGGAGGAAGEDFRLGAGDAVHGAEAFQVGAGDVGDQRHVRLHQAAGPGDFAGGVGAQLDHRLAVLGVQTQQRERHADVVVEVAVGGQGALAQQDGDHFFNGGLAGVAGDRHARHRELGGVAGGQAAQTLAGIGHAHVGVEHAGVTALFHQCGHRAGVPGLGQEGVAVKTLAAQRHEQAVRAQLAGVGADRAQGAVAAAQLAGGPVTDLGQAHHAAPPAGAGAC